MGICDFLVDNLFEYDTPKFVRIRNVTIGLLSRLIQIAILGYIIGYAIIYKKGYQDFSEVESSVTTKIKGVAYSNFSSPEFRSDILHPEWYNRIWDTTDFVVPPQENGAAFIGTNVIITADQAQGVCAENSTIQGAVCTSSSNCTQGASLPNGHGVMTGNCINTNEEGIQTCEIHAWCPLEVDVLPLISNGSIIEASNFTVLIKNFVDFPKFPNSNRRNIKDTSNKTYLTSCIYDAEQNPECPIFRLGDIVRWTGNIYEEVASEGAVISVVIHWDCNFDFDKKFCFPTYSFNRLDNAKAQIAPGWNFRYAHYFGNSKRTLYKMYGIRLVIIVQGQAGKFRIVPLLLNIGSGLGLLALEVIVCDIVTLYLMKKRNFFKSKKYEKIVEDDVYSDLPQGEVISTP